MQFRSHQLEQMGALREADYHRRLMIFFRETLPDQTSKRSDAELLSIIAHAVRAANEYSIHESDAVVKFVGLCLLINPQFYEHPVIQQYLSTRLLDGGLKIELLVDALVFQLTGK